MRWHEFLASYWRLSPLVRIIFTITTIICLFGIVIHIVEPRTFLTVFDGIWWALITTTTIGYGDLVPKTMSGKLVAITLILLGTAFVSAYFVTLSTKAISKENALSTGELPYTKGGHIILVGWNERIRQLLAFIPPNMPCLVIDETLKRLDVPTHVHFIKGNPTHDDVWEKANVFKAHTVIITANQHKNEVEADLASIVTLLTVKALHPSVYAVVEILTTPQVDNAKRAGANEIVETNKWISFLMANCLSSPNVLHDIEQFKQHPIKRLTVRDEWIGMSFATMLNELKKENVLLVGIANNQHVSINPPSHTIIQSTDELIVLE
ncbi:potassium channel family protein [Anoxybacillus kestanbolensis]|uniref:Potassium channel protein n=1 Tax=Anoxybacillus kestanbolensis TaxID=227476 RepID=A0A1V3FIP8_9BACL|nr:potassium channel protein [Anoxybacillus kestanbolensis]OOE01549.1 potassium channel protein [Anoxybacillus kestanbolensis]QAV25913.1 potassium channel protein [Neobacillus thermocopriae]